MESWVVSLVLWSWGRGSVRLPIWSPLHYHMIYQDFSKWSPQCWSGFKVYSWRRNYGKTIGYDAFGVAWVSKPSGPYDYLQECRQSKFRRSSGEGSRWRLWYTWAKCNTNSWRPFKQLRWTCWQPGRACEYELSSAAPHKLRAHSWIVSNGSSMLCRIARW